jgi:hypothetical protein
MSITREKANEVLKAIITEEYGRSANAKMKNPAQHEFDMGCSGSFNVGVRIFGWKWCKAFNEGDKPKAAALWRNTATTARGKKLAGLVRRRKEEADLLLKGDYGRGIGFSTFRETTQVAKADPDLLEYQKKLTKLGYAVGAADGWMGPNTAKAIKDFQETDPYLINDGILGRGTMASIDRKIEDGTTKRDISITGATGVGVSVFSWLSNQSDLITYVLLAAIVLIVGYVLIKYRRKFEAKLLQYIG